MGGKKRAAVLAASVLVVLLLLSGELPGVSVQVQARVIIIKPLFRLCYDPCYSHCREHDHQPKAVCELRCWFSCAGLAQRDSQEVAAAAAADASAFAGGDGGSCGKEKGCLMMDSVSCGTAATGGSNAMAAGPAGADVAACVDGAAPLVATTEN